MLHNLEALPEYIEQLRAEFQVPALSIAVLNDGQIHSVASGIANLTTGVSANTETLFHIGSVTKVFTACLIMKLVERGRVELDLPVKYYLRDFCVADSAATETITVRQLLCHSNGLCGDFFPDDLKQSGNPIARYLDRCNFLPQVHAPGAGFSYSNAAYAIAGRLVEVLSGISWFEAVEEWIYKPLGMQRAVANPLDMLKFRGAMGHVPGTDNTDQWQLSPQAYFSMGLSPGGRLSMTATELLRFAVAHLNNGQAESGEPWLGASTIAAMQSPQVIVPSPNDAHITHWGLGWQLLQNRETPILRHNGLTAGQSCDLWLLPEKNSAFAVQTNCNDHSVLRQVHKDMMCLLAGLSFSDPELMATPDSVEDRASALYAGTYQSLAGQYEVQSTNGHWQLTIRDDIGGISTTYELKAIVGDHSFALYTEQGHYSGRTLSFVGHNSQGIPSGLFTGQRHILRA